MADLTNKVLLEKWNETIENSHKSMKEKYFSRWKSNYEAYKKFELDNQRGEIDNYHNLMERRGKIRSSVVFSTIVTKMAKLSVGAPWIRAIPDSPGDTMDWEVFEIAVNKAFRMTNSEEEVRKWILDGLLYGIGYAKLGSPAVDDYQYYEEALFGIDLDNPDAPVTEDTFDFGMSEFVAIPEEEALRAQEESGETIQQGMIPDELLKEKPTIDYQKKLPTLKRLSPFNVIIPKFSKNLCESPWMTVLRPVSIMDLKNDQRYDNATIDKLLLEEDGGTSMGVITDGEAKKDPMIDRSRGKDMVILAEVWVRVDPFRTEKNSVSGYTFHYILGHPEKVLFKMENPYKKKVIPIFDFQPNPLNDDPIGPSEVDAMYLNAIRTASVHKAMTNHFVTFSARKMLARDGAIDEPNMERYTGDAPGDIVTVDDINAIKPAPHTQMPNDWMSYMNITTGQMREDVGLDAFQRGSAVKDISASQVLTIDKSSQARIEQTHSRLQAQFQKILPPYAELLITISDEIFVDVGGQGQSVNFMDYMDQSFIYGIDPVSLKPSVSMEEAMKYLQFIKIAGGVPQLAQSIDWRQMLRHIVHAFGLPKDILMNATTEQAQGFLQQLSQDPEAQAAMAQTGFSESQNPSGTPGSNTNPLADDTSGGLRL